MSCAACRAEKARLERERALFAERAARPSDEAALWARLAPEVALAAVPPPRRRASGAGWAGTIVAAAAAIVLLVRFGGTQAPGPAVPRTAALVPPSPAAALPDRPKSPVDVTVQPGDAGRIFTVRELPKKIRWEFDSTDHPKIRVENIDGEINVHASTHKGVTISARPDADAPDPRWKLEVRAIDDGDFVVRVFCDGGRCDEGADVAIGLEVPIGAALTLRSVSGDISLHGGTGTAEIHDVSGEVVVGGARAIKVHTTSGDVMLDTPNAVQAEVDSVSGDLLWQGGCGAGCAMRAHTVSGDVSLELDAKSSYQASFRTVSGDGPAPDALRRGSGAGVVTVQTVSGDLHVEP